MRRNEYWVKDDGSFEPANFATTREWCRRHPNRDIKLVDVKRSKVLIYSLRHNGSHFDFDGAELSKETLARILKEADE